MSKKITIGTLATLLILSLVGTAMAATPLIHVTYNVHNDSDSGEAGYWALDNYTQTLTITPSVSNTYIVNVSDVGQSCTFAGAPSPQTGTPQQYNGCVSMIGGYNGILTTSVLPVNTSQTTIGSGTLLFGGTENGILLNSPTDTMDAYASWIDYFFPGATTVDQYPPSTVWNFADNGYYAGWTYTAPNGDVWVDSGYNNWAGSGDIVLSGPSSSGGVNATGSITPLYCSIEVSPSTVSFGNIVPGNPAVNARQTVGILSTGDVDAGLSISATPWSIGNVIQASNTASFTTYQETWNGVQSGPGSASGSLSISPFSIGAIEPLAGSLLQSDPTNDATSVNLLFAVAFPDMAPYTGGGQAQQTITVISSC